MANLSDALARAMADHGVELLRLSAGISRELMPYLTQLESDIVKQLLLTRRSLSEVMRLQAILREVRQLVDQAYVDMGAALDGRIGGLLQIEGAAVAKAVNGTIGIDLMAGTLPKNVLKEITTQLLIQGAPSKDWW